MCVLNDRVKVLSKPISDLCNLSITSEKLPDICKVAILKPLYKKGSLIEPCNYRPVTPNIKSYRKGYSRSSKYFPKFQKPFIHLSIWFSKKTFYRFLSFLFE